MPWASLHGRRRGGAIAVARERSGKPTSSKPKRARRATGLRFSADYQEIGRILLHVEEAGGTIPITLRDADGLERAQVREQRGALAADISWAFTRANIHPDLTDNARAASRYERLGQVSKLADKLLRTIEFPSNPLTDRLGSRLRSADDALALAQLLDGLRHLSSAAHNECLHLKAAGLHQRAPFGGDPGVDAGDERILKLGRVFETTFGETIRFPQKDDDGKFGPFVAFVMAIYRHAGADMTPESVRTIWRRAQNKTREIPVARSCDAASNASQIP